MLKSKFAKRGAGFKANRIFTDRIEPREVFNNSIDSFLQAPQEIVVYYGKGGIGKSKLLKTIYNTANDIYAHKQDMKIHSIFISLDAYDYSNPINILIAIRNGIVGDCGLFDYAVMQYCAKARMSVEEIMQKSTALPEQIMEILNDFVSLGTLSACVPTATIKKCVSFIKDIHFKRRYKEEIEEIATLNEFEIFERLPYYLGLCLSYSAEKGNYHVIFIDSYESFLIRVENDTPSVDREEWVKELFLSSKYIRIIIASRDRLRWDQYDNEWNHYLHQYLLNNLSDEDSRWFLEQIPINNAELVELFVKRAQGVPLYLDMCVSIYEEEMNRNKPIELSTVPNGDLIIDRYLRHLPPKGKRAVKILAALKSFDLPFANQLLKKMNVVFDSDELSRLLERSIFLKIDENRNLWKVDESVRLHQRSRISHQNAAEILASILSCIVSDPKGSYFTHLSLTLETACDWPDVLENHLSSYFSAIDYYANVGFWNELHQILFPFLNSTNRYLQPVAMFEELIYLRRIGKLKEALVLYNDKPLDKQLLGEWFFVYRYIGIQIKHLLGLYDESLEAYRKLIMDMDLIRPMIPDHIYLLPCIKYADLLFLKGRFDESMKLINSLIANNTIGENDLIEFLRIKGHIFRFRQLYHDAEFIYRSALKIAEENKLPAFLGKLYTNITETLCVTKPSEALEWFHMAVDENEKTYNEIELGKAYAAASVAYTKMNDFAAAVEHGNQAVKYAEQTGYLSGKAFALAALYFAYKTNHHLPEAEETKMKIDILIHQIGVYEFIWERVNHD